MNRISRRMVARSCLTLGLLLCCYRPVAAATTGQLIGVVADDKGMPLPGVAISAVSPTQIGGEKLTDTDLDGRFKYPTLAPGFFTVRLTLDGFVTQELAEVQIRVDRTTELRVSLPQASFGDTVEVLESTPVVDPMQISTGQTFSDLYITETAGMFGSWEALIEQAAGTDGDRIMGSTPESNTYLLDSMDATNKWFRSPTPASSSLPVDALQEVSFHSSGFEAEYGQATGGVINVVTKSGGNRFAGNLDLRYSDNDFEERGVHYDPDEQESDDQRVSVTLGGPILRDRLWFFSAYTAHEYTWTPTGAPTTGEGESDVYFGKLTWQASPSWSAIGKLSHTPLMENNDNSSPWVAPEATSSWGLEPTVGSVEVAAVLSSSLLWNFRLGRQELLEAYQPADGDLVTIGHFNLFSGESYGNYPYQGRNEDVDNEVSSEVGWFVDDLAGSHDVRAGVRWGATTAKDDVCSNGHGRCWKGEEGFRFLDWEEEGAPIPLLMRTNPADGEREFTADYQAAFVQDAWWVRPGLTVKLGVRWDRAIYDNALGQTADLSKLQPRLGTAWDVTGNGRNLVRASWGRFMSPGTMIFNFWSGLEGAPTEYWYSCSDFGFSDPAECAGTAADWGIPYRTDQEGWDPVGWVLDGVVGAEPVQVADDLRPMYVDQWMIGFERELFRRTALEVSYLNKRGTDLYEDTCHGNYPLPSEDADCDFFITANLLGMRSDYEALLLRLESRALDRIHLLGSWVISDSKGSVDRGSATTADFDIYPYTWVNRYGYLPDQSRHRLKLSGYALLPYDFTLGINGWWSSEFRWTPFGSPPPESGVNPAYDVFLEPRGSRQGGSRGSLDLQIGKGFRIGRTRLRILGSVFNLFDSESVEGVCERVTGCGDLDMGEPTDWQQPRSYQLGMRVEF